MSVPLRVQRAALRVLIAKIRQIPDLPEHLDDPAPVWVQTVKGLRETWQVKRYLERTEYRNSLALRELADEAADWLAAEEHDRLVEVWQAHERAGMFTTLTDAAKLTLAAIYCQALRTDCRGGRRVLLARGYLRTLIEVQFGRRLSLTAITVAIRELEDLWLVERTRKGTGWNQGGSSVRTTQFTLPLEPVHHPRYRAQEAGENPTYPAPTPEREVLSKSGQTGCVGDLCERGEDRGEGDRQVRQDRVIVRRSRVVLPAEPVRMSEQTRAALEEFAAVRRAERRRAQGIIDKITYPDPPPPDPTQESLMSVILGENPQQSESPPESVTEGSQAPEDPEEDRKSSCWARFFDAWSAREEAESRRRWAALCARPTPGVGCLQR